MKSLIKFAKTLRMTDSDGQNPISGSHVLRLADRDHPPELQSSAVPAMVLRARAHLPGTCSVKRSIDDVTMPLEQPANARNDLTVTRRENEPPDVRG